MLCGAVGNHEDTTECEGFCIGRTAASDKMTRSRTRCLKSIRARGERRDQCLSLLEISREFVSWRGERLVANGAKISLGQSYLTFLLIANEGFGCFGLPGAVQGNE
jgi:hypothetical protein